mgnify:FL=1|jgi:hypothetical protein
MLTVSGSIQLPLTVVTHFARDRNNRWRIVLQIKECDDRLGADRGGCVAERVL